MYTRSALYSYLTIRSLDMPQHPSPHNIGPNKKKKDMPNKIKQPKIHTTGAELGGSHWDSKPPNSM